MRWAADVSTATTTSFKLALMASGLMVANFRYLSALTPPFQKLLAAAVTTRKTHAFWTLSMLTLHLETALLKGDFGMPLFLSIAPPGIIGSSA